MRRSRDLMTVGALVGVLALLATPGALADDCAPTGPDAAQPSADPSGCPVIREATELWGDASGATTSAMRWVRANVNPTAMRIAAAHARRAADCQWERLVDGVRADTELGYGIFLYTPGSGTSFAGDWTPEGALADGPDHPRVVLLVHGLDEPGGIWSDLAPTLADAGMTVACFNYPNDQNPVLSADALALALRTMSDNLATTHVDLVCHSMGGLIGRDLLTRPEYYNGEGRARDGLPGVGRLITVGTPNHGSALTPLRALGEVREHLVRWMDTDASDIDALLGFLADGDGSAADALEPGSDYLTELNARPLPRDVKMTVIIGRVSPLTEDEIGKMLDRSWLASALGPGRTDRLRAQADSLVETLGDAIVTMDSARLDGVADTVILDANHRSLLRRMALLDAARSLVSDTDAPPPAIPVIVSRLTDAPGE